MRIENIVLGRPIQNSSQEGILLFIPRKIVGKDVYGVSYFIPNEPDIEASRVSQTAEIKKGSKVYIGTIKKLSNRNRLAKSNLYWLSQFREVGDRALQSWIRDIFELEMVMEKTDD